MTKKTSEKEARTRFVKKIEAVCQEFSDKGLDNDTITTAMIFMIAEKLITSVKKEKQLLCANVLIQAVTTACEEVLAQQGHEKEQS